MTDLEMTRLCAEARELDWCGAKYSDGLHVFTGRGNYHKLYDPLHDDAQAMALVKKFAVCITLLANTYWEVVSVMTTARSVDLNRAIVECVAKMQRTR